MAGFGGITRDLAGLAGLAGLGVAPRLYDKSNDFDIKICNHPTFLNLGCFQSDVALLKFAEPFEFNDNVKKIDIDDNIPSTGESVTLAGKKLCMLFKTVYYNYIDRVPGKSPAHIRKSTKILDVIRIMLYEP